MVIWYPYLIKHQDAIERVQRRATKSISTIRDLSYEERLKHLKLPSVHHRQLRGDMIELWKLLHEKYDIDISSLCSVSTNRVCTRGHSLKLVKSYCRTTKRQNSFKCRHVNEWNSLPEDVVSAPSTNAFKARLDRHWENHPCKFSFRG